MRTNRTCRSYCTAERLEIRTLLDSTSWTGAEENSDWFDRGNWTNGVPGSDTDAEIPMAGYAPYINDRAAAKSINVTGVLVIWTGQIDCPSITVSPGGTFEVSDLPPKVINGTINNNGRLWLSGTGLTGTLVVNNNARLDITNMFWLGQNSTTLITLNNPGTVEINYDYGGANMENVVINNSGTFRQVSGNYNFWNTTINNTGTFEVTGGSMLFRQDTVINNRTGGFMGGSGAGDFILFAGGTLDEAVEFNGRLTGTAIWEEGALKSTYGFTVTSTARLDLANDVSGLSLFTSISNYGEIRWTQGTVYTRAPGLQVFNFAGARFEAYPAGIWHSGDDVYRLTFNNRGTFVVSGEARFDLIDFNNTGSMGFNAATRLSEVVLNNSGTVSVGSATLNVRNSTINTVGKPFGTTGTGMVLLEAWNVDKPNWLNGGIAGYVRWLEGRLNSAKGITIPAGATLELGNDMFPQTLGGNIINDGTILCTTGAPVAAVAGVTITNRETGLIDLVGDRLWNLDGERMNIVNYGRLRKAAGELVAEIRNVSFTNAGTVRSSSGTIHFNGGSTFAQPASLVIRDPGADVTFEAGVDAPSGRLTIIGSSNADTIEVALAGGRVSTTRNGALSRHNAAQIASLLIRGEAGDDTINASGAPVVPATVHGGAGADSILGTAGADELRGDDGNDTIRGFGGNDIIYGNAGDDLLNGGDGADSIYAGLGNDLIFGGSRGDSLLAGDGMDTIYGGDGDDYIEGRGKADSIYGEGGNDTIYGGAGSDWISGGEGNDLIDVGPASVFRDTVLGGLGVDTCTADADDLLTGIEVPLLV